MKTITALKKMVSVRNSLWTPPSLDSKGQAALTDSLFFLAIIATICTSLFFFAINYGLQMEQQVNSFYASDFSNDALKVVTYVNVLRTGESIYAAKGDGTDEFDYLLALIKEDYASQAGLASKSLGPETRLAIASTLDSVLKPFQDSIDYSFYLVSPNADLLNASDDKFLFLLLATHQCASGPGLCNPTPVLDPVTGNYVIPSDEEILIERVYYYCQPKDTSVLEDKIFPFASQVDTALGKITLFDSDATENQGRPFIMGLNVWVSKDIPVLSNLDDKTKPGSADFNCTVINVA